MKKVEYSQIVRRKLKNLRARLTSEFGAEVSRKSVKQITDIFMPDAIICFIESKATR